MTFPIPTTVGGGCLAMRKMFEIGLHRTIQIDSRTCWENSCFFFRWWLGFEGFQNLFSLWFFFSRQDWKVDLSFVVGKIPALIRRPHVERPGFEDCPHNRKVGGARNVDILKVPDSFEGIGKIDPTLRVCFGTKEFKKNATQNESLHAHNTIFFFPSTDTTSWYVWDLPAGLSRFAGPETMACL